MGVTHNYIYLGRERGKRVVHKVGKTTQTCWGRCGSSDYLIGVGIDIQLPGETTMTRRKQLNEIEMAIISFFADRFPIEHGQEYFRTSKHPWEVTKVLFLEEMERLLDERGWNYEIHEGWVAPNTY